MEPIACSFRGQDVPCAWGFSPQDPSFLKVCFYDGSAQGILIEIPREMVRRTLTGEPPESPLADIVTSLEGDSFRVSFAMGGMMWPVEFPHRDIARITAETYSSVSRGEEFQQSWDGLHSALERILGYPS